jgi:hypothetical protein
MTRWRSTGRREDFTSSGMTKSRPSAAAFGREAARRPIDPRGEAPRYTDRWERLFATMSVMYVEDAVVDADAVMARSHHEDLSAETTLLEHA